MKDSENNSELNYRIKINNALIESFFQHPIPNITQAEIREVRKLIMIVFNKYFHKYAYMKRELLAVTLAAVLERHRNFDPRFRAFNYVYTIARNEIGNRIKKVTKETLSDELAKEYDRASECDESFDDIRDVAPYLAGDFKDALFTVSTGQVHPIMYFIEQHTGKGQGDINEEIIAKLLAILCD